MPNQFSPEQEHIILEADIARLAQEVKRHKESPEMQNAADREILKMSLQSLAAKVPPATPAAVDDSLLPTYIQNASAETKLEVEYLLDLVWHHGLEKAVAAAKKSSPFVLDAFHDALTGKLYPEFQKRGLLK